MALVDTVQRIIAGPGVKDFASLALAASTTETAFSKNALIVAGSTLVAAVPGVIQLPDQGAVPSMWDLSLNTGMPFMIRGRGFATTGATTNLTIKLYQVPSAILTAGTAATLANDNVIFTSTARAINSTTGTFTFECENMQWNSITRVLQGRFTVTINNLTDAIAATTAVTTAAATSGTVPTGQATLSADAELNFIVSATLSAGNAANVVTLQELAIGPW